LPEAGDDESAQEHNAGEAKASRFFLLPAVQNRPTLTAQPLLIQVFQPPSFCFLLCKIGQP
jgi:hypothetical protein